MTRRIIAGLIAGLLFSTLGGCTTNPTTGRSQLALISRSQAIAIGEQSKGKLTAEMGGKVQSQPVQSYVTELGMNLKQYTEGDSPSLPWEFTLLDSEVINAFALPGGKVFISRGLAEQLTNEAQIASILGHEIGHVTAQHVNERTNRMFGLQLGLAGIAILTKGKGGSGSQAMIKDAAKIGQLAVLSFDRKQETEADALGIRYMTRAGYNPIGSLQAMQVIANSSQGGQRPPEFFSTHPYPERRVNDITGWLNRDYPEAVRSPQNNIFDTRYRMRLLNPLAIAPVDEANRRLADAMIESMLGDARSWCAHCAEQCEETKESR